MKKDRNRHTVWLDNNVWSKVREHYREDNCSTQNEFIEKAICFYTGYLDTQSADTYLPRILVDVLGGALETFTQRIGKLLFKYAVEQNMTNHILAADTDMDVQTYDRLRGRSYREVQETNGQISFRNAVTFQKTV